MNSNMNTLKIEGSVSEWQPYCDATGTRIVLRRKNGEIIGVVGSHELVEAADGVSRFDPDSQRYVSTKTGEPTGPVAKPRSEMPKGPYA